MNNNTKASAREWTKELATTIAAQCWCDPTTSMIEMDSRLAIVFAARLQAWMESYAQAERNTEFYRGIVTQVGEIFGDAAKIADDGTMAENVLALKVPELVAKLRAERNEARILFNKEYNEANESRRRLRAESDQLRADRDAARELLREARKLIVAEHDPYCTLKNCHMCKHAKLGAAIDAALKEGGK